MKLPNLTIRVAIAIVLGALFGHSAHAESTSKDLFVRLYKRLAVQINGSDPRIAQGAALIDQGNYVGAAQIATADNSFYNVTLYNFFARMANRDAAVTVPLNEAMLIGIGDAKNDRSYAEIVTGNHYYTLTAAGLSAYSAANDNHYLDAYNKGIDYVRFLSAPQIQPYADTAGMMTASSMLRNVTVEGGTNRRAIQFGLDFFLGVPIDTIRTSAIATDRITRDVDRQPGGKPEDFMNKCKTCHSWIDPMRDGFSRFDARSPTTAPTYSTVVSSKINARSADYPAGFVSGTQAEGVDGWQIRNMSPLFGWDISDIAEDAAGNNVISGNGVNQMGQVFSRSHAFWRNGVVRAWTVVCQRAPEASEQEDIDQLTDFFRTTLNGRLKALFEVVAIHPNCLGR